MKYQSLMDELGTPAPRFALRDVSSAKTYELSDFSASKALLVAFLCNHCPFVLHILDGFIQLAADYRDKGLAVVAISSNDIDAHPEDGPAEMAQLAAERHFGFPYLYDESQDAALAFRAVCTPDLFLYDAQRRLAYHGQFDSSRPITSISKRADAQISGLDLRLAIDAVLGGRAVSPEQKPSMGCNMKWKPGKEPEWD